MSFHKKPAAPALSLKQSSAYGKLPSDAIVGIDRRDLPPSLRRSNNTVLGSSGSSQGRGRTVPSYMQGTQTSQRRDIGLNVRRLAKTSSKMEQDETELKGYGAPAKLPSLYEQAQLNPKPVPVPEPSEPQPVSPQQSTPTTPPFAPLQLAKSREATAREVQQITKTCRYVRRKGSLIDPPSYYYKR